MCMYDIQNGAPEGCPTANDYKDAYEYEQLTRWYCKKCGMGHPEWHTACWKCEPTGYKSSKTAEAMEGANMETFNLDREITWLQEEIGFDVCAAESGDRDGLYRERMADNKTKLEKLQAEAESMKGNQ